MTATTDFTATISERSPRYQDWSEVFGGSTVPLKHFIPQWGNFPGVGAQEFYEMDISALTTEQRSRLIAHIARRFHLPEEEVTNDLDKVGCPLLAEDLTITVHNPQRWV